MDSNGPTTKKITKRSASEMPDEDLIEHGLTGDVISAELAHRFEVLLEDFDDLYHFSAAASQRNALACFEPDGRPH